MVIHWPKGITAKGEVRSQWHHVIDIAPTILEAAGLPEPKSVNGTVQKPIEGVSLVYTFADAKAPDRHATQYFEIFGNRAIYDDGWLAGTVHRAAWEFKVRRPLEDVIWELYDARADFSLANDLAAKNPEKLKELQDLFYSAVKHSQMCRIFVFVDALDECEERLARKVVFFFERSALAIFKDYRGFYQANS